MEAPPGAGQEGTLHEVNYFDELVVKVAKWRSNRKAKAAARMESAAPSAANEAPQTLGGMDIARMLEGTAYKPGGRRDRASSD